MSSSESEASHMESGPEPSPVKVVKKKQSRRPGAPPPSNEKSRENDPEMQGTKRSIMQRLLKQLINASLIFTRVTLSTNICLAICSHC